MKALIYIRSSDDLLIKNLTERCRVYCSERGLEVRGSYFDIGVAPSSPRSKWKGFEKLLEAFVEGDCIVCDSHKDLPLFFNDVKPPISVNYANEGWLAFQEKFTSAINGYLNYLEEKGEIIRVRK